MWNICFLILFFSLGFLHTNLVNKILGGYYGLI